MSPNNFTQGYFMKTERLVADVTTVGSPDRTEQDVFWCDLGFFCPFRQVAIAVGEAIL